MSPLDLVSTAFFALGLFFFFAAAVGLVRFPDTLSRLHALTKADNVGLGLILTGILLQADSPWIAGKLVLIWLLTMISSATSCFLLARRVQGQDSPPEGSA
jgi:multicomponent Na+:H+ antiporter subunit G